MNINLKKAIGKTKTRSQMLALYTEDGRVEDVENPVMLGCAASDKLSAGWLLDPANQFQDEESGVWYQLVGERSAIPIDLIKKVDVKDFKHLLEGIFDASAITGLTALWTEAAKDRTQSLIVALLGSSIILATLVLGIGVIRRGGL